MNKNTERVRLRDKTVELQVKFEKDCKSLGINVHSGEIVGRITHTRDTNVSPAVIMRSIVCVPKGVELPPFDEYYKAVRDYENFMKNVIGAKRMRSPMPKWINGKDIRSKRPDFDVTTITYRFNRAWSYEMCSVGSKIISDRKISGQAIKISATHYDSEGFRVCTQKTLNRILLIPVADNYEFKEAQRRRSHHTT